MYTNGRNLRIFYIYPISYSGIEKQNQEIADGAKRVG